MGWECSRVDQEWLVGLNPLRNNHTYSTDEQYRHIKVLTSLFHLIKPLRFVEFGILALLSNISSVSLGTPSILRRDYRRTIRKSD